MSSNDGDGHITPNLNFGGGGNGEHEWRNRMFLALADTNKTVRIISKDFTDLRIKLAEENAVTRIDGLARKDEAQQLEINALQLFRVKITTAFVVIQIIFAGAVALGFKLWGK